MRCCFFAHALSGPFCFFLLSYHNTNKNQWHHRAPARPRQFGESWRAKEQEKKRETRLIKRKIPRCRLTFNASSAPHPTSRNHVLDASQSPNPVRQFSLIVLPGPQRSGAFQGECERGLPPLFLTSPSLVLDSSCECHMPHPASCCFPLPPLPST